MEHSQKATIMMGRTWRHEIAFDTVNLTDLTLETYDNTAFWEFKVSYKKLKLDNDSLFCLCASLRAIVFNYYTNLTVYTRKPHQKILFLC